MILADLGATHQTDMDVLRRACVEELPESGVARLVYDVAQAHLSPMSPPCRPHIAHISPTYLPPTYHQASHTPPTHAHRASHFECRCGAPVSKTWSREGLAWPSPHPCVCGEDYLTLPYLAQAFIDCYVRTFKQTHAPAHDVARDRARSGRDLC